MRGPPQSGTPSSPLPPLALPMSCLLYTFAPASAGSGNVDTSQSDKLTVDVEVKIKPDTQRVV